MRNQIYTVRRPTTPAPALDAENLVKKARPGRKKRQPYFYFEPQTYDHSHIWTPIPTQPNEIIPAGKWSERQSEEAILHIIRTLNNARLNSDENVFERVFRRFLARLSEIEYMEDLVIPERKTRSVESEHETEATTPTIASNDDEDTEMDLDDNSIDELQEDHYPQQRSKSRQRAVLAARTKEKRSAPSETISTPPSGSLLSYLPATYPATMAAYITPFSSSNAAAPYGWIDAPCLPSSYFHFVEGIRLRANVPKLPHGRNLVIVLAYSWNNFCRVLKNEQDWNDGFQQDIRRAAENDRVDVWRLRVCCFA